MGLLGGAVEGVGQFFLFCNKMCFSALLCSSHNNVKVLLLSHLKKSSDWPAFS